MHFRDQRVWGLGQMSYGETMQRPTESLESKSQEIDGRFIVALPFKPEKTNEYKAMARKRIVKLEMVKDSGKFPATKYGLRY